jgi:hypothetical protein
MAFVVATKDRPKVYFHSLQVPRRWLARHAALFDDKWEREGSPWGARHFYSVDVSFPHLPAIVFGSQRENAADGMASRHLTLLARNIEAEIWRLQ